MSFFTINPKSRYHPYGPKYLSTLTNKGYRKSKLSTAFSEPLVWSRGNGVPEKLEWDFGGVKLNQSQAVVYKHLEDQVISGAQFFVYVGGPAGTGKSVVLRKFVNFVKCHHSRGEACAVAAPLGMAACNVDGVTLHTLLGMFPGDAPFTRLSSQKCDALYEKLRHMRVLVIDEISLVSAMLFSMIDHRLREIFNSDKPFGGISIVLFGDLLQLPPVPSIRVAKGTRQPKEFIFSSIPDVYMAARDSLTPNSPTDLIELFSLKELTENVRTKDRREAEVLEAIRLGEESNGIKDFLLSRCRMVGGEASDIFRELRMLENEDPSKSFMVLAATNEEVDALNDWRVSNARDISVMQPLMDRPSSCRSRFSRKGEMRTIRLFKECKIMVTENIDVSRKMANGVMGEVVEIGREHLVMKRLDNGKKETITPEAYCDKYGRTHYQFPVAVAEAITVHKSQGMTFDGVVIASGKMMGSCNGRVFGRPSMFYTALSRSKSLRESRIVSVESVVWASCKASGAALDKMRRRTSRMIDNC